MCKVSRETEAKNQKEMHTIIEVKNSFDGLIDAFDRPKERFSCI